MAVRDMKYVLDINQKKKGKIKMLVKATNKYEKLNIKDKELDRVPKAGEEFEVTEERYKVLTQTNEYKEVFVEQVSIEDEVEINEENIVDEKDLKENEIIEVKADKVNITKKKTTRKKK